VRQTKKAKSLFDKTILIINPEIQNLDFLLKIRYRGFTGCTTKPTSLTSPTTKTLISILTSESKSYIPLTKFYLAFSETPVNVKRYTYSLSGVL